MSKDLRHQLDLHNEVICKDIKTMMDMLVPMVSSYRLLVGAADELNKVAMVHRHDLEEAIDRVDDLGDIIDDIQKQLKRHMRLYLKDLDCKGKLMKKDLQVLHNSAINIDAMLHHISDGEGCDKTDID